MLYEDEDLNEVMEILAEESVNDPTALINPDPKKDYKWCVNEPERGYEVDQDPKTQHILRPKGAASVKRWNELILCCRPKRVAEVKKRFMEAKAQATTLSSLQPLVNASNASIRRTYSGEVHQDCYPTMTRAGQSFDYNDLSNELQNVNPALLSQPDFKQEV